MDIETTLQKAGFTQNEVKVYLTLLKLGEATSYIIVEKAKISSGKIYETLQKLIERGLVSYVIINGKKRFKAADPERLLDYMRKREEDAREETQTIQRIIPTLNAERTPPERISAELFEGIGGVKTVYELMLRETNSKESIFIFGAPKEAGEKLDAYFDDFNKRRIKKKIHIKIILNHRHPREQKLKSLPQTNVKVFPNDIITPSWIIIFNNYVATVNLTERAIVFLLKDRQTAESYRQYFSLMWKIAM